MSGSEIVMLIVIVVLSGLLIWQMVSSSKERRELYDRIQAGTLRDYVYAEDIRKQPVEEPAQGDPIAADDEYDPNEVDIIVNRENNEMNAELERLRGGYATAVFGKRDQDGPISDNP